MTRYLSYLIPNGEAQIAIGGICAVRSMLREKRVQTHFGRIRVPPVVSVQACGATRWVIENTERVGDLEDEFWDNLWESFKHKFIPEELLALH